MGLFDNNNAKAQSTPVNVAPQVTDAYKEANRAKAKAYRDALDTIANYIKNNADIVPAEVMEAAKKMRPSAFGIAKQGGFAPRDPNTVGALGKLLKVLGKEKREDIQVGDTFDEMKLFQTLKLGRKDGHILCNDLIKRADDGKEIYVAFDADSGVYTVKGIGAAPADWNGYVKPAPVAAE